MCPGAGAAISGQAASVTGASTPVAREDLPGGSTRSSSRSAAPPRAMGGVGRTQLQTHMIDARRGTSPGVRKSLFFTAVCAICPARCALEA